MEDRYAVVTKNDGTELAPLLLVDAQHDDKTGVDLFFMTPDTGMETVNSADIKSIVWHPIEMVGEE